MKRVYEAIAEYLAERFPDKTPDELEDLARKVCECTETNNWNGITQLPGRSAEQLIERAWADCVRDAEQRD